MAFEALRSKKIKLQKMGTNKNVSHYIRFPVTENAWHIQKIVLEQHVRLRQLNLNAHFLHRGLKKAENGYYSKNI